MSYKCLHMFPIHVETNVTSNLQPLQLVKLKRPRVTHCKDNNEESEDTIMSCFVQPIQKTLNGYYVNFRLPLS